MCRCLDTSGPGPPKAPAKPRKGGPGAGRERRLKSPKKLQVPPSIVFPLIKDGQLKEKLRALGLPITGKRAVSSAHFKTLKKPGLLNSCERVPMNQGISLFFKKRSPFVLLFSVFIFVL
jgi:hypothetical protein